MPNVMEELTAAEKHEAARAFALSGGLSKFQQAKQRKKAVGVTRKKRRGKVATTKATKSRAKRTLSSQSSNMASTVVALPSLQQRNINGADNASTVSIDPQDKHCWPRVTRGVWQYVYIASGPFAGKFGYYDDQEGDNAIIYFGAPLLGEGPYEVPVEALRQPPTSQTSNAFQSI
jgi:hypothetical protein